MVDKRFTITLHFNRELPMKSARTSKTVNRVQKVNIIGIKVKSKPLSVAFVNKDGQQVPQESVKTLSNKESGTQLVSASK